MNKLTVEYIRTSSISLCYSDEKLQDLIDESERTSRVKVLLRIPRTDSVRLLCGLLSTDNRIKVAKFAARRAKDYACAANAYAAAAAAAARHAAGAAVAYAAGAAACAAGDADDAYNADYEITIRYACMLLGWGVD
jgi:hypothetical protein